MIKPSMRNDNLGHKGVPVWKCPKCGKRFQKKSQAMVHILNNHKEGK